MMFRIVRNFRKTIVGKAKFFVDDTTDDRWIRKIWQWAQSRQQDLQDKTNQPEDSSSVTNIKYLRCEGHTSIICDGPPALGQVFVKLYQRRTGHSILRRLRANRPRREAAGLLAFAKKGLLVPELLAYGDERSYGLFERGIVVTALANIEDIPTLYNKNPQISMIAEAANLLAKIHHTGFSHGDACIRNFARCESNAMIIDLASWKKFSKKRWIDDITRFLGSTLKLTNSESLVTGMTMAYKNAYGRLPLNKIDLLTRATDFAARKTRP